MTCMVKMVSKTAPPIRSVVTSGAINKPAAKNRASRSAVRTWVSRWPMTEVARQATPPDAGYEDPDDIRDRALKKQGWVVCQGEGNQETGKRKLECLSTGLPHVCP